MMGDIEKLRQKLVFSVPLQEIIHSVKLSSYLKIFLAYLRNAL